MLMRSSPEELRNCMAPTGLSSAILLLITRQINALIRAKSAERLSGFQESRSHDAHARKR